MDGERQLASGVMSCWHPSAELGCARVRSRQRDGHFGMFGAIGGRIKGPIREGNMLATRSQFARRSLGVLRQHLEHHVQLIEHVLIHHHWVLEFLKTRNSKLDTGVSPLFD